jgi:hypothetical protein
LLGGAIVLGAGTKKKGANGAPLFQFEWCQSDNSGGFRSVFLRAAAAIRSLSAWVTIGKPFNDSRCGANVAFGDVFDLAAALISTPSHEDSLAALATMLIHVR